jgi:hypothetical protein
MSVLPLLAAQHPEGGFDVFTILGIAGIILGIIVLALRVASHGHTDYTRHGDVGFSVGDRGAEEGGLDADGEAEDSCSECVAGK